MIALFGLYAIAMVVRLFDGRRWQWLDAAPALAPIAVAAGATMRRTVRIYQNGIWVPTSEDKTPAGFLTWDQIERYQLEGDALLLAGTESMLKGGPVPSRSILVPRDVQAQVMSVLAGNIRSQ